MLHVLCMGKSHTTHVAVTGQTCGLGSLFMFWGSNLGCQVLMMSTSTSVYRSSIKIFSHSLRESACPLHREERGLREVNALNQWAEVTSVQAFWLEPLNRQLPNTYSLCSYLDFPFYFIFLGCSANWQLPNSLNHAILLSFLLFLLTDLHYETQTCNQLVNLLTQPLSANDRITGVVLHAPFSAWVLLTKKQED